MKGIVAACAKEAVTEEFGVDRWREVAVGAGLPADVEFSTTDDLPDEAVLEVVASIGRVLGAPLEDIADLFGKYWIKITRRAYAPLYSIHTSSQEMLLAIDEIHQQATRFIPGATPPIFTFDWDDDDNLIVTYTSERNLMAFAMAIARHLVESFGEKANVKQLSANTFSLTFD